MTTRPLWIGSRCRSLHALGEAAVLENVHCRPMTQTVTLVHFFMGLTVWLAERFLDAETPGGLGHQSDMARLILHLVLSLLLAFGGLPAAAHDHRMANPVAASVAADAEADGGSCHGELANTSDKAPFAPCCGGPDCQCGCLLPVALTGGVATALTRAHVPDPPQPAVRVPAASREPLLRPPSAADAS